MRNWSEQEKEQEEKEQEEQEQKVEAIGIVRGAVEEDGKGPTCALRCDGSPEVSVAVEVLRRVLEHPVAHVVVADAVDRQGLEPPPACKKQG